MKVQFISDEFNDAKITYEVLEFPSPPLFNDYIDLLSFGTPETRSALKTYLTSSGKVPVARIAGRQWKSEKGEVILLLQLTFEPLNKNTEPFKKRPRVKGTDEPKNYRRNP